MTLNLLLEDMEKIMSNKIEISRIVPCWLCGKPVKVDEAYGFGFCNKECLLDAMISWGGFIIGEGSDISWRAFEL